jgi:hypothetical protein
MANLLLDYPDRISASRDKIPRVDSAGVADYDQRRTCGERPEECAWKARSGVSGRIHPSEEERMGMVMAAPPLISNKRRRALRACLGFVAAVAVCSLVNVAPAAASVGKVLVFTGTAGTPNSANAAAVSTLQANAAAGNYTVDVTDDPNQITSANLANYRAVVFVNSAGNVLTEAQENALQGYVEGGGGFVGIGETAKLEEGVGFFDTLIGLTGAQRTSSAAQATYDIEFNDRVNPVSRDNPPLVKARTDVFFNWTNNPTGSVHTVARVRTGVLPDGTSVTNDATNTRWGSSGSNASSHQPQSSRALSWCRDIQNGRSFYTGLGQLAGAYDDVLAKHLAGAVQWAAGMVRGNCKATINSNYSYTRLTPANPSTPSAPLNDENRDINRYIGEVDALAMADDGRVFYAGRAVCFQGQQQYTNWTHPLTGLGCGPIHVWDPRGAGPDSENPARITRIANLAVFGAKGGGAETGATSKTEQGILGIALDPDFTKGRPYIYVTYHPYYGGKGGFNTSPRIGPGFVRSDYMGERRLSRFTYNEATKSLDVDSEVIIHRFMTQVYSCCHLGGSMDFDSEGNLYFATGDNVGNAPNSNNGGYVNSHPQHTVPCPGGDPSVFLPVATSGCGVDTSDPDGSGPRPPRAPCAPSGVGSLATCGYISYGDARQTSGNTNAYEGKLLRIKPLPNPGDSPGIGTTYTIPGPDAPNGPNLFAPDSEAVRSGKAKPEIFAMGVRNLYSISVDRETDTVAAAWVGPDQGVNSQVYGPAKTENAVLINSAGNYGWPFCTGNQQAYAAKDPAATGGGAASALGRPGTVGGGVDGQTGAFWDCDDPEGILNDSPFNTGLERIPSAKPVNIWYGPHGGCPDFPRNANGVPVYTNANNSPPNGAPGSTSFRRCPWVLGGSQAPMTAGIYRKPKNDAPYAWPEYWEGRWFLADFAGAQNLRHALLMDPETEFTGGQPLAVDSLFGILTQINAANRAIDLDFGREDGMLYVADYGGSNFTITQNTSIKRWAYIGGPDTPGPDPQAWPSANSSLVNFTIGRSGGVSYKWRFSDGATAEGANVSHTFLSGGSKWAELEVTYADGEKATKRVTFDVPTTVTGDVQGSVPPVLSLSLGDPAAFGRFTPAVANTYTASTTATVTSTLGSAALTVLDPSPVSPGHLVNGDMAMVQPLRARATNATQTSSAFAPVSANPLTLLTYNGPATADTVAVEFQQQVGATDALRAGAYSKTLTFTLATTDP